LFFKRKNNGPVAVSFAQRSEVGRVRTENQDSCGKFPEASWSLAEPQGLLFVVADGMGGHMRGREASALAVQTLQEDYFANPSPTIAARLQRAFHSANARIYEYAQSFADDHVMGTTCSALLLKDAMAYIAHVGDSRIYRINRDGIWQLTHDHTEAADLVQRGILTEHEAQNHPERSMLTRALGIELTLEVDLRESIPIQIGDYFLLCTDGLVKVDAQEIKKAVIKQAPEQACEQLIQLALARGGHDNVTVQVARVKA